MGKESVNVMILESAFSERKIPILFGLNRSSFIKYNNDQTQTNNESTNQQVSKVLFLKFTHPNYLSSEVALKNREERGYILRRNISALLKCKYQKTVNFSSHRP